MTLEYRSPLKPNRVYTRKFDHDEARRLLADGMTLQAVADRLGVSYIRVWQISSPERMAAAAARTKEWQKVICDDCGRECSHNWSSKHGRHDRVVCLPCARRRHSEDHLFTRLNAAGDILCNGCGQYLPHEEYRLTKTTQVPTSRCRNCETTTRRDYRRTHREQDEAMNEVCPSCGEFVRSLYEVTGWCASCSTRHGRTCTSCGERRDLHDFYKMRGGRRSICKTCDIQARQARRDAKLATA